LAGPLFFFSAEPLAWDPRLSNKTLDGTKRDNGDRKGGASGVVCLRNKGNLFGNGHVRREEQVAATETLQKKSHGHQRAEPLLSCAFAVFVLHPAGVSNLTYFASQKLIFFLPYFLRVVNLG